MKCLHQLIFGSSRALLDDVIVLLTIVTKFIIAIICNMTKLLVVKSLDLSHITIYPINMGIIGNKNNINSELVM